MSTPSTSKSRHVSHKASLFTESVIREMTREALKHGAVNLSQGFPDFAAPDDVKKMAQPVLAHRLILKPESRLRKRTPSAVVKDLVDDARVPITDKMKAAQVDVFDD